MGTWAGDKWEISHDAQVTFEVRKCVMMMVEATWWLEIAFTRTTNNSSIVRSMLRIGCKVDAHGSTSSTHVCSRNLGVLRSFNSSIDLYLSFFPNAQRNPWFMSPKIIARHLLHFIRQPNQMQSHANLIYSTSSILAMRLFYHAHRKWPSLVSGQLSDISMKMPRVFFSCFWRMKMSTLVFITIYWINVNKADDIETR